MKSFIMSSEVFEATIKQYCKECLGNCKNQKYLILLKLKDFLKENKGKYCKIILKEDEE